MSKTKHTEIVIIGAGISGISAAYYLAIKHNKKSITLIDERDPMSYTTAQSGDNYRNWWPHPTMTAFTNESIELLNNIALESSNSIMMNKRGYLLASRKDNIDKFSAELQFGYSQTDEKIRINSNAYSYPNPTEWQSKLDGVDILSKQSLIQSLYPSLDKNVSSLVHIRKAGGISGQQLGQFMLEKSKPLGVKIIRGRVSSINHSTNYALDISGNDNIEIVKADLLINAAGPFASEIAKQLNVDLPVKNTFQQKLAFEDVNGAIPRDLPFAIDIDPCKLEWGEEERMSLQEEPELSWLTETINGGIHCRPEGNINGKWIKLGWAFNQQLSIPNPNQELTDDPQFNPSYPEIVLRGAAILQPSLKPYIENLPKSRHHYGGYYTMTDENWPLIGPLNDSGAFMISAMSGFGSMASCAAGALCAAWACGADLPHYAQDLSLARYENKALMNHLSSNANKGLL